MAINVTHATSWLSDRGGGVFTALSKLSEELSGSTNVNSRVVGLLQKGVNPNLFHGMDNYSVCDYYGPESLGFSPCLKNTLINNDAIDLIHSHGLWMYSSYAVTSWHNVTKKPYIVSAHGMLDHWALNNSKYKKLLASLAFERKHLQDATCLHALTLAEAQSYKDFGLDNPVCVIPNGVELPTESTDYLPDWYVKIPNNSKILLFLGRIHSKKGIHLLIESMRLLKHRSIDSSLRLIIAGWGQESYLSKLHALVDKYKLHDFVFFIGPQFGLDKDACFRLADAFVLPSYSEGLPMAVLEAWSYKLPVFMTMECNLANSFDNQSAIEIRLDVEDIAQKISQFLSMQASETDQIGQRGYNLVRSNYSWEIVMSKFSEVYRWLLEGGQTPESIIHS